jgi:hypothetical protein
VRAQLQAVDPALSAGHERPLSIPLAAIADRILVVVVSGTKQNQGRVALKGAPVDSTRSSLISGGQP